MKCLNAENCIFNILIFCLCIDLSVAYTGVIPADPENPGKCFYRGDLLKAGVNNGILTCQRLTCLEDGSVKIEGCGRLRIKDCNRGERVNLDKPYPECCLLKYKCRKSDGATYYIERDVLENEEKSKTENST